MPYLFQGALHWEQTLSLTVLFILSIMTSSPLLACSVLLWSPLAISPQTTRRGTAISTADPHTFSALNTSLLYINIHIPIDDLRAYTPTTAVGTPRRARPPYPSKPSRASAMTMTVVVGRRSSDVWLTKSTAVDNRNWLQRALSILVPTPSLSVLLLHSADNVRDGARSSVIVHDKDEFMLGGTFTSY